MCVTVCNSGVRGDQVYTELLGTDKEDGNIGRESKAKTALVNATVFERHRKKAEFYLAWGNTQKAPALQRGGF